MNFWILLFAASTVGSLISAIISIKEKKSYTWTIVFIILTLVLWHKSSTSQLATSSPPSITPEDSFQSQPKIKSISNIAEKTYVGSVFSLPNDVQAEMTDNSRIRKSILWDVIEVNTSKTGEFTFNGSVEGYDKKVILNLTVLEPYLTDVLKPYAKLSTFDVGDSFIKINEPITLGNDTYYKTIKTSCTSNLKYKVVYDLKGEYSKLIFDVVVNLKDSGFKVEGDDQILWKKPLTARDLPTRIEIDLKGVKKLSFYGYGDWNVLNPIIYKL
jgi:hypothetical protein